MPEISHKSEIEEGPQGSCFPQCPLNSWLREVVRGFHQFLDCKVSIPDSLIPILPLIIEIVQEISGHLIVLITPYLQLNSLRSGFTGWILKRCRHDVAPVSSTA